MAIVEVAIDDQMIDEATRMAKEVPILNHSIRKGEGTIYVFLGELIFRQVCGGRQENTYDYDIVMKSGRTVDVKTSFCAKIMPFVPKDDFPRKGWCCVTLCASKRSVL